MLPDKMTPYFVQSAGLRYQYDLNVSSHQEITLACHLIPHRNTSLYAGTLDAVAYIIKNVARREIQLFLSNGFMLIQQKVARNNKTNPTLGIAQINASAQALIQWQTSIYPMTHPYLTLVFNPDL